MTDLRELLKQVADGPAPPSRLSASEVFAAGRRRRWSRRVTLGGVAAAVALAATAAGTAVVPAGSSGPPVQLNVVYAMQPSRPNETTGTPPWQILDPRTGLYRTVNVSAVSPPTADLRYAAVTIPLRPLEQAKKIGRYESTTGEIRWYDIPVTPERTPAISPNGKFAVVVGSDQLVVVDLDSGVTTSTAVPGGSGHQLAWQSDSQRILFRNQVLDLDGRVVAVRPVPADAEFIAAHPDGPGLLVRLPTDRTYGITDGRGRLLARADLSAQCPCYWFLGWNGREDERVLLGINQPADDGWTIYATDLDDAVGKVPRTRLVHRISGVLEFVIAPLNDRIHVPGTDTF
jgi:hypothetical protein